MLDEVLLDMLDPKETLLFTQGTNWTSVSEGSTQTPNVWAGTTAHN